MKTRASMSAVAACFIGMTWAGVSPRIILDSQSLGYASFPEAQWEKLNSGWKYEGKDFVRPFNRPSPGLVRYGGVIALPDGVKAELKFVDVRGRVLTAEKLSEGTNTLVRGAFRQEGDLAELRLEPSRAIPPKDVFAKPLRVTVDWAVDDPFTYQTAGRLPSGWQGEGAKVVDLPYLKCARKDGKAGYDAPAADAVLEISPGGSAEPAVAADLRSDDYAYEFDALVEADTLLTVAGVDMNSLYRYTPGIWYHFRLEVSHESARLRLNGRIIAERLAVSGFTLVNRSKATRLLIDDVKVFALEAPADYPPAPVRPKGEEKWDVLLNVCPLWYNGYHAGWSCVEHGHGPKPVLGYYDEGLPETADWEIKYMVEHGIDVQLFCWYSESHDGPIRQPRNDFHLRDGFKNARYSDAMKYALIWEVQNAGRPHSLEAWRKNYVPYLIEHHFKDPRYYTVDGKVVLFTFGGWNFTDATSFGSAAATKAAFDCLGDELKKIGFKGVYPVFCGGPCRPKPAEIASSGFAAAAPYGFGHDGCKLEMQKKCNLDRVKGSSVFEIPMMSVGFNSEPWHGTYHPMLSPADCLTALTWIRHEFIPSLSHKTEWEKRVIVLSNWNEYGEGTYLMPTDDERDFGYLDAIRRVFTDEAPNAALNQRPTTLQKSRICNLYPQQL